MADSDEGVGRNWAHNQASSAHIHHVPISNDLSLAHLLAELARLDVLLNRQVALWQVAGQNPNDAFRGLYVSDQEAVTLVSRPFGASWGQLATLDPQVEQQFTTAYEARSRAVEEILLTAQKQGQAPTRLQRLASAFDLDSFDINVLLVCLAPSLDLRYERIYGYLQDDVTRKRPAVNLVLDLLMDSPIERTHFLHRFSPGSPLFIHRLVELAGNYGSAPGSNIGGYFPSPLLSQILAIDESIVAWLLGHHLSHHILQTSVRLYQPRLNLLHEMVGKQHLGFLFKENSSQEGGRSQTPTPILVFFGPDVTAQHMAAEWLADQQGRPLYELRLQMLEHSAETLPSDPGNGMAISPDVLRLSLRDAWLAGAIPYLVGWDTCLVDGAAPPSLLEVLCDYRDMVVVAGRNSWRADGIDRERTILWVDFPLPGFPRRFSMWKHFIAEAMTASASNEMFEPEALDLTHLAGQFVLTTGNIRDAVTLAHDWAAHAGRPVEQKDYFAAARHVSSPRLSSLARKIIPRYGWADIVLPADQISLLHEIINTVRQRPRVLDEWGVGNKLASSRGVTVLFAGQPGTGKTMAAEIISGELGLDLYKINLSTIISKYIGETEKNLERIFNEAESSNAILFFDEADALFGKRSEVRDSHDRYANIEISYLLQRMEAYDGVTILATNLRANLDEAFTRRLQFAVDFPFPEEVDRLRIWETLFPADVPRDPGVNLNIMAKRFKLAGGNIRNILVSAAYLAAADGGVVTMTHIMHGARRELQKMGRLVGEADLSLNGEKYDS